MVISIVVCVEYDDFLAITLPRNKRHFDCTIVVTSPKDLATQELVESLGLEPMITNAFYERGASFNKGAAIEKAFEEIEKAQQYNGWLCIWDADIVMPDSIQFTKIPGNLYTPIRRILKDPTQYTDQLDWNHLPSPTRPNEFDGYFQLFHPAKSSLALPWYGTQWKHAGGCDSEFSAKFSSEKKRRPSFEVLHLGDEGPVDRIGRNWMGRTTARIDGKPRPAEAPARAEKLHQMIQDRKKYGIQKELLD